MRQLWEKLNEFRKQRITVGQSLPPYILIGLLWWLSVQSDRIDREEEVRENAIQLAILEYDQARDDFIIKTRVREACEDRVELKNNNIQNWHDLFIFLSLQPGAEEFTQRLRADFDSKPGNQPLDVETECAKYPIPTSATITPLRAATASGVSSTIRAKAARRALKKPMTAAPTATGSLFNVTFFN